MHGSGGRNFAGPVLAALMVVMASPALAGDTVYAEDGIAIRGTDPVAYFKDGRPVAGKPEFEARWMGTTWRFSSAAHRDAFKAAPGEYAPQFGGYCAWAVSQGYTATIVPEAWSIVRGKLYLNFSKSIQRRWKLDRSGNIAKGDRNWPGIRAELEKK